MPVTRLGGDFPILNSGFGSTTNIPGGGSSGQIVTSNGSNGAYWGENIARISANGSNALLGPFVSFNSGSNITLSVSSNAMTIASSGGGGFDLGWFNVEDYGAVHDGTTDDTVAIQAAIDACFAAGGGTVWFPVGTYQIDGALRDTGTYNSQLEIPYNATGIIGIRFLGEKSLLRSSWNGVISGTPSVISAGTHDTHTLNGVFVKFERIQIQCHDDPKLTAIDMTAAATVRWDDLLIYTTTTPSSVPTHSNAMGLDMPWGFNDQNSGGNDLYVIGFYTGIRPSEQTVGTAVYIAYCARAAEFRGSSGSPDYLAHMASFLRFNVWFCVRGLVFTGDRRSVNIQVLDIEHNDPSFVVVYDIDDASNYARGFVGIHISDYTTGDTSDNLLINGGTGISIFIDHAKRWRFANVLDIPTGTDPSTNPSTGRFVYAASATGHLSVRTTAGAVVDLESGTSPLTTKGDLYTYSTTNARLAVGSNGTGLYADSGETTGNRWTLNPIAGELLISDTPSTPLVFADVLQTDTQDDLIYADL